MKFFMRWFLVVVLIIVLTIISLLMGACNIVLHYGLVNTVICLAIFIIFIYYTGKCGWIMHSLILLEKYSSHDSHLWLPIVKYIKYKSDCGPHAMILCAQLGLIGTVLGFLLMLIGIDWTMLTNPETARQELVDMGVGMGTALVTTLIGTITGLLLRKQYYILSQGLQELIHDKRY